MWDECVGLELVRPERTVVVFSQNLNRSLGRAIAQAEQQSYGCATPEHVLLALLDDPDTIPVFQACNIDLQKLRDAVEASMPHSDYILDLDEGDTPESDDDDASELGNEPIPIEHFQVDLQRAIAHARSSECEEVNSADVLVALLHGPVGDLMNTHGITRYDVTTFISHGISKDAQAASLRGDAGLSAPQTQSGGSAGSSAFKVRLLNDNYTTMDFVVHVLDQVFELKREDAEAMVLKIHSEESAVCGSFTREEAEARTAWVMKLAREHQQPLRCVMEQSAPQES